MEMVSGKLQVVAGTAEKLFLKLADETAQGMSWVIILFVRDAHIEELRLGLCRYIYHVSLVLHIVC